MPAINPASLALSIGTKVLANVGANAATSLMGGGSNAGQTAASSSQPDLTSLLNSTTADLHQQTLGTPVTKNPMLGPGLGPVVPNPVSGGDERSDLMKLIRDLTAKGDPSDADLIKDLEAKLGQMDMQQAGNGAPAPGGSAGPAPGASLPPSQVENSEAASPPQLDPETIGQLMTAKGQGEIQSGKDDMGKGMQALMSGDIGGAIKDLMKAEKEIRTGKQDEMKGDMEQVVGLMSKINQDLGSTSSSGASSGLPHLDLSGIGGDNGSTNSDLPSGIAQFATPTARPRSSAFDDGELDPKSDSLGLLKDLTNFNAYNAS